MPVELTPLRPDADGTITGTMVVTPGTAFYAVLADDNDNTYIRGGVEENGTMFLRLSDTTPDVTSLLTVRSIVRVEAYLAATDDTMGIYAQIFADSAGTTALTNEVQVAFSFESTAYTERSVAHTIVGTPTKAQWDGAWLRLRWVYTRSMSADGGRLAISKYSLAGTYEPAFEYSGPVTMSSTGTLGLVLPGAATIAEGIRGHEMGIDPIYQGTSNGVVAVYQELDDTPQNFSYGDYAWLDSLGMPFIYHDWRWPSVSSGVYTAYTGFYSKYMDIYEQYYDSTYSFTAGDFSSAGGSSANSNERLYKTVVKSKTNNYYAWTMYTEDGDNWVVPDTPLFSTRNLLVSMTLEYVPAFGMYVMATAGGEIYSSVDGLSWTLRQQANASLNFGANGQRGAYSPTLGRFIYYGNFYSGTQQSYMYYSDDGITWIQVSFPGEAIRRVSWIPEKQLFFACCTATGKIYTSPDGASWTLWATPDTGTYEVHWVQAWSLYVAVTGSQLLTSPTGATWTQRLAFGQGFFSYSTSNARAIYLVQNSYYSTDGTTWTASTSWTVGFYYQPVVCGNQAIMYADYGRSNTSWDREDKLLISTNYQNGSERIPWSNPQNVKISLLPVAGTSFLSGTRPLVNFGAANRNKRAIRVTDSLVMIHGREGHAGSGYANYAYYSSSSYIRGYRISEGAITSLGSITFGTYSDASSYPIAGNMVAMTDSTFIAAVINPESSGVDTISLFTVGSTTMTKGSNVNLARRYHYFVRISATEAYAIAIYNNTVYATQISVSGTSLVVGTTSSVAITGPIYEPDSGTNWVHMFSQTEGVAFYIRQGPSPTYINTYYFLPFTISGSTVTFHTSSLYVIPTGGAVNPGAVGLEKLGDTLYFAYTDGTDAGFDPVRTVYASAIGYNPTTHAFTNQGTKTLISNVYNYVNSNPDTAISRMDDDTLVVTIEGYMRDRPARTSFAEIVGLSGAASSTVIRQSIGGVGQDASINIDNPTYANFTPRVSLEQVDGTTLNFGNDVTQTLTRSLARLAVETTPTVTTTYIRERALTVAGAFFWTAETSQGTQRIHKYDIATGARRATWPSPSANPGGMAWDGTNLWLSDNTSNIIYKINPVTGATISQFTSPRTGPQGLAWDGTNLWVNTSTVVARLNPSTGAEVSFFTLDTHMSSSSPVGLVWHDSQLWVSGQTSSLVQRYTTAGALRGSYEHTLSSPWGLAHDGTSFYVLRSGLRAVHRLDLVDAVPSDFASVGNMTWRSTHHLNKAGTDDTYTLATRIVSEDGAVVLAAADGAGAFQTVGTVSGMTPATVGPTSYAYLNQVNDAAVWASAKLELRQTWVATLASDVAAIRVDQFELIDFYTRIAIGLTVNETNSANAGSATVQSDPVWDGVQVAETDTAYVGNTDRAAGGLAEAETDSPVVGSAEAVPYGGPMQFLRPDGTTSSGQWLTQSGSSTNLHLVLDEVTPDDTDFIEVII